MKVSRERLAAEATATGFRPDVLEKVIQFLNLLEAFQSHPFLKGRIALKGGTAINIFLFNLPRLSVDVDLNYIGSGDRDVMLAERPKVEEAIGAVLMREGFTVRRVPQEHAGGKWRLRFPSALGAHGTLEVDVNFVLRTPLWPVVHRDSHPVGSYRAASIPVVDDHELAAGKLSALFSRRASRDLFDAHQLLTRAHLDRERLRLAFVVYGGINRKDWRTVSVDGVGFEGHEVQQRLIPLVREEATRGLEPFGDWASLLVRECQRGLGAVLPFEENEREFLDSLLDQGEVKPSLLTADPELAERIRRHPGLEWKALNVRRFKKR